MQGITKESAPWPRSKGGICSPHRQRCSLPRLEGETAVGNAAGFHVFNGDGTGQDYVTFTMNGVDQHVPSPNDLTYTLNPDCTGTYKLLPLGVGLPTFDVFVSPNGDEMAAINTDPGSASSYTPSRRVAPK